MSERICVLGAGVNGLSTALRLAREGKPVSLIAGEPPTETASVVAAAYWAPYWVGDYPPHWASETLQWLQQCASRGEGAVHVTRFEEWLTESGAEQLREEIDTAYWWRDLPGIRFRWRTDVAARQMAVADAAPHRFTQRVEFETPVARMPEYLDWMYRQLHDTYQVELQQRWISSLEELAGQYAAVINCTGWAAKTLVNDDPATREMRLLAGHVVRVEGVERDSAVSLHRGEFGSMPLYLVPRVGQQRDMICGGTAIEVLETPDPRQKVTFGMPEVCEEVWQRCVAFEPSLAECTGRESMVALRPVRASVRVERDPARPWLFHNYGHGGAGLTLSWGTAGEVARLVEQALS